MGASCSKQELQATTTTRTSRMEKASLVTEEARRKRSGSSSALRRGIQPDGDETENNTTTDSSSISQHITGNSWLDELSDETLHHILSFVSYAPFEVGVVVGWEDGRKRLVYYSSSTRNSADYYNSQQKLEEEHKKLIQEYCNSEQEYNSTNTKKRKTQNNPPGAAHDESQGSSSLSSSGFFSRLMNRSQTNHRPSGLLVEQPERFGTLTHVLPLVNQRWHHLCGGMLLWTEALERNLRHGVTWERGFNAYWNELPETRTTISVADGKQTSPATTHLDRIRSALVLSSHIDDLSESTSDEHMLHARDLYRIIKDKRQLRLPIFHMAMAISSYETSIGLFLFEPRYCLLIREAMAHRSEPECTGVAIAAPRPRFLFAAFGNARHAALWVEIWSCVLRPDGTAQVTIRPVPDYPLVATVDTHVRPDSGGLREATLVVGNNNRTKTLPAFGMSVATDFLLQDHIFLRFFEGRYKILIAEIMKERSDEEWQGRVMNAPFPQFLFVSNSQSLEARLLDVVQCTIHPDGSADLVCRPAGWVVICSKRMRPGSGGLYDATVLLPPSTE